MGMVPEVSNNWCMPVEEWEAGFARKSDACHVEVFGPCLSYRRRGTREAVTQSE
jgi:hypothetical protein